MGVTNGKGSGGAPDGPKRRRRWIAVGRLRLRVRR